MSDKTAAVKVNSPQPEQTEALNPQAVTKEDRILEFLIATHNKSELIYEIIGDLPEIMEEKIKVLLQPSEGKPQTLQVVERIEEKIDAQSEDQRLTLEKLDLHNVLLETQNTLILEQTELLAQQSLFLNELIDYKRSLSKSSN